jgi:hypothetical protein
LPNWETIRVGQGAQSAIRLSSGSTFGGCGWIEPMTGDDDWWPWLVWRESAGKAGQRPAEPAIDYVPSLSRGDGFRAECRMA